MMAQDSVTIDAYCALAGREIGISAWIEIDQPRIDAFACV